MDPAPVSGMSATMPRVEPLAGSSGPNRNPPLAEVSLEVGTDPHWLRELVGEPGLGIVLQACRPFGASGEGLVQLVELSGSARAVARAEGRLAELPSVSRIAGVTVASGRRLLWVAGPLPEACARVFRQGAVCLTCRFLAPPVGEGKIRWSLVTAPERPRSDGPPVLAGLVSPPDRLVGVRPWKPTRGITPRQRQALETAFRLGYFSVPRRARLKELASSLGVSRPAAAELLRRGQQNLMTSLWGGPSIGE